MKNNKGLASAAHYCKKCDRKMTCSRKRFNEKCNQCYFMKMHLKTDLHKNMEVKLCTY